MIFNNNNKTKKNQYNIKQLTSCDLKYMETDFCVVSRTNSTVFPK